jgi:hypothetical protein
VQASLARNEDPTLVLPSLLDRLKGTDGSSCRPSNAAEDGLGGDCGARRELGVDDPVGGGPGFGYDEVAWADPLADGLSVVSENIHGVPHDGTEKGERLTFHR